MNATISIFVFTVKICEQHTQSSCTTYEIQTANRLIIAPCSLFVRNVSSGSTEFNGLRLETYEESLELSTHYGLQPRFLTPPKRTFLSHIPVLATILKHHNDHTHDFSRMSWFSVTSPERYMTPAPCSWPVYLGNCSSFDPISVSPLLQGHVFWHVRFLLIYTTQTEYPLLPTVLRFLLEGARRCTTVQSLPEWCYPWNT